MTNVYMVVIPILSYNIHTSDLLKLQEKGRPSVRGHTRGSASNFNTRKIPIYIQNGVKLGIIGLGDEFLRKKNQRQNLFPCCPFKIGRQNACVNVV